MNYNKLRKRHQSPRRQLPYIFRRIVVGLIAAGVVTLQTSCGFTPPVSLIPEVQGTALSPGFAYCPQFFAGGAVPLVPKVPKLRELCFDSFAVLHSGSSRTPVFAAERTNRQLLLQARDLKRTDRFFADARLPQSERAEVSDYKNSGYARGHMAPAGNMASSTSMAQSFSLANVVPQNPQQNSGAWAKIETDTRSYVMRAVGDVYVLTGPIFGPINLTIGINEVRVPTHLFKVVYDPATQKAWVHWQQNAADARAGKPIRYSELVQRTGIEWLPGVTINELDSSVLD